MTKKRTPAISNEENLRKALSNLMTSLIGDESDALSRVEMVEEALTYAALALGAPAVDHEKLTEKMELLAAQILVDGLDQDGTATRHISILNDQEEEAVAIITTAHPSLLQQMNALVDRHVKELSYAVN